MEEFPKGHDNFNHRFDDNQPNEKKPNVLLDILIGIGISVVAYALILFVSNGMLSTGIAVLITLLTVAAYVFLIVKFFRTSHTAAAVVMIISISPAILVLLLWGACSVLFRL
ncbi:MAG TPA: hypothetical protein VF941_24515 [Clostridia bacterium]